MTCFEKNPGWSGCLASCKAGIHAEESPQHRTPWTCRVPRRRGIAASGPSIFGFAICSSSGSDLDLLRCQARKDAGIFGCNAYRIFSDKEIDLPHTQVLPQVVAQKGVAGAMTATWVNAQAFIAAWEQILTQNLFTSHDWVVKADPDCVFVPGRLKSHLAEPRFDGPAKAPLGAYLKNCAAGPRGLQLFGAIEVLSRNAVRAMRDSWARCSTAVDPSLLGEDMWLQRSLDLINVQAVEDYSNLVDDGYCPGLPAPKVCSPGFVAFHPMKLPEQWLKCWNEANV